MIKIALLEETNSPLEFIAGDEWVAQEKLNGERMVVMVKEGQVSAYNRQGEPKELPAVVEAVALTSPVDFILDGEWVDGGFVAFDALSISGVDLTSLPQVSRFAALQTISPFLTVRQATTQTEKVEMLETIRVEKGEGVVFKSLFGTYLSGRSAVGVKFKFWKSGSFMVEAINIAKGTASLGQFGNCAFPFAGMWPKVGEIIEVRYLLITKHGKLSQPTFLGVRNDLTAEDLAAQILK